MAYSKYQIECNGCDITYVLFANELVEEEPVFCPFCGVSVEKETLEGEEE